MLQLDDASLGPVVAPLETLGDVVALGWDILAVVVHDEFTHDVVVGARAQEGSGPRVLVFETT